MTTENEKVAGYIVPEVYERFDQFCQENNLSCSRALNVIIAEYFGMEECLIYKQTWVGGVTLPEFEKLKKEVQELRELVNTLSKVQSITPKDEGIKKPINEEQEEISKKVKEKINQKVKEGLSKKRSKSNNKKTTQKLNTTELAKRLKVSRASINTYKKKFRESKITKEDYIEWSRTKDPEGKGWFFDENTNYSV